MTPPAALDARVVVSRGTFRLDVSVVVDPGRTVAIVGPNGAGKSTLLRALCGLLPLDRGHVVVDGREVGALDPAERRIGVVFQDLRLFPHLDAVENVAFGIRATRTRRRTATAEARRWLERLGVAEVATLRPHELSGGQAQRVALARTLATEPRVILLDEPLSALDATARADVRRELRRHLDGHDGARVVVTHDPSEAAALADELVVIEAGRIVQRGGLGALAAAPASPYVADLVGVNRLTGTARGTSIALPGGAAVTTAVPHDGPAAAVVHPRAVALHGARPEGSPRNVWRCEVAGIDEVDGRTRVVLVGDIDLVAEITTGAASELDLRPGATVWASVKATEVTVASL